MLSVPIHEVLGSVIADKQQRFSVLTAFLLLLQTSEEHFSFILGTLVATFDFSLNHSFPCNGTSHICSSVFVCKDFETLSSDYPCWHV